MGYLVPAVVIAVLAFADQAQATLAPWQVGESMRIAREAWPESPCRGREVLLKSDDLLPPGAIGQAFIDGTCRVRVSRHLEAVEFCIALTHEFGHLAGHLHSEGGVMAAENGMFWSPCQPVDRLYGADARTYAADVAKVPRSACRFARGTADDRIYRCGRRRVAVALDAFGEPFDASFID